MAIGATYTGVQRDLDRSNFNSYCKSIQLDPNGPGRKAALQYGPGHETTFQKQELRKMQRDEQAGHEDDAQVAICEANVADSGLRATNIVGDFATCGAHRHLPDIYEHARSGHYREAVKSTLATGVRVVGSAAFLNSGAILTAVKGTAIAQKVVGMARVAQEASLVSKGSTLANMGNQLQKAAPIAKEAYHTHHAVEKLHAAYVASRDIGSGSHCNEVR